MTGIYHYLPAFFWLDPVASPAALPDGDPVGAVRLSLSNGAEYWWNGTTWQSVAGSLDFVQSVTDTSTINLTVAANNLSADLIISDGTAAGVGAIGQILSSSVAAATSTGIGATGVYGNVTSIALTAGDWSLTGVAGFSENGATLTTSLACGFSSNAAGATLGALDAAIYNHLISSTSDLVAPVPTLNVSVTVTTTYYLNTRFFYTAGAPQHYGRITARRMR